MALECSHQLGAAGIQQFLVVSLRVLKGKILNIATTKMGCENGLEKMQICHLHGKMGEAYHDPEDRVHPDIT